MALKLSQLKSNVYHSRYIILDMLETRDIILKIIIFLMKNKLIRCLNKLIVKYQHHMNWDH